MEEMEFQGEEIKNIMENPEQDATRNLDQSTLEPAVRVEQTGDIAQAEAIQTTLVAATENMVSAQVENAGTIQSALPIEEKMVAASPDENQGVSVTPINIPLPTQAEVASHSNVQSVETVGTLPTPIPETAQLAEIIANLPGSGADAVEVLPNPLPSIDEQSATQVSQSLTGAEAVEVLPNPLPDLGIQASAVSRVADDDEEGVQRNTLEGASSIPHGPLPNENLADGVQAVGASVGEIKDVSGLTPIQMPMPDPEGPVEIEPTATADLKDGLEETSFTPDLGGPVIGGKIDLGPLGAGAKASVYTGEVPVEAAVVESAFEAAGLEVPVEAAATVAFVTSGSEGTTGNEGSEWKPPTMYANTNPDGSITVVDANGNKVDSPPIITMAVGSDGTVHYYASYPDGSGAGTQFEIQGYSAPTDGMYIYKNADGSITVVDANGKPVDAPPKVTITIGADGKEKYLVSYPGGDASSKGALTAYEGSTQGMYVYTDKDGTTHVVDANGKPVDSPPLITKSVGADGKEVYTASYPGSDSPVTLSAYSGSMEGLYIAKDKDGNLIVVNSNGMKVDCPPLITQSVGGDGKIIYSATYPGEESSVVLEKYVLSPSGLSVYVDQDGKMTILDKNGTPMDAQWKVEKYQGWYYIYMADADQTYEGYTQVKAFSQPLTDMFIHLGQDGKPHVVDISGKPIAFPPQITSFVDSKGQVCYSACYPDSQPSILGYYKPPSAT